MSVDALVQQDWLGEWLTGLNLSEYQDAFTKHGYTSSEVCAAISKEELKRIGVTKVGHLNRLNRALEKLKYDVNHALSDEIAQPPSTASSNNSSSSLGGVANQFAVDSNSTENPPPVPKRKSLQHRDTLPPPPEPSVHPSGRHTLGGHASYNSNAPPFSQNRASLRNPPPVAARRQRGVSDRSNTVARLDSSRPSPSARQPESEVFRPSPVREQPEIEVSRSSPAPEQQEPPVGEASRQSSAGGSSEVYPEGHPPANTCGQPSEEGGGARSNSVSSLQGTHSGGSPSPKPRRKLPVSAEDPGKDAEDPGKDAAVPAPPTRSSSKPPPPPRRGTNTRLSTVISPSALGDVMPSGEEASAPPPSSSPVEVHIADQTAPCDPIPPEEAAERFDSAAPPILPPRAGGLPPAFTPPPPPTDVDDARLSFHSPELSDSPPLQRLDSRGAVPAAHPQTPSPEPAFCRVLMQHGDSDPPPPPPPRRLTLSPQPSWTGLSSTTPPLPPRDAGVPNFQPSPPPFDRSSDSTPENAPPTSSSSREFSPPLVPSNGVQLPPPPPPITEHDFPEAEEDEDSCSEDDDDRPLMSITSTNAGNGRDDILLMPEHSDGFSSPSTGPSTPSHVGVSTIRQSGGATIMDDVIMLSSPLVETDLDYANQDAIDRATAALDNGDDYANQDAIDESIKISSSNPIKSRAVDADRDYENQDVIDEDIIPLGTLPLGSSLSGEFDRLESTDSEASPRWNLPREYSLGGLGSSVSDDEEPIFGDSLDGKGGTFPRVVDPGAVVTDQKPRALTTVTPAEDGKLKSPDKSKSPMKQPSLRYAVSVPGGLTDGENYFDGPLRSTGTFSGVGADKKLRPQFLSTDTPTGLDASLSLIVPQYSRVGSTSLQNVPRTKDGFLFKRGGKQSQRPWQKRWMSFDGVQLRYYRNQVYKESESLNSVKLGEMIDIKKVNDSDKPHRFDLIVSNRVFQFYAESASDCQVWVDCLHAAISRFRPQDDEDTCREGGAMHNPDRQGWLLKQGHGVPKAFKDRYVALKGSKFAYYETKENFMKGKPIHTLDMCLSNVRPDMSGRCRFIITMMTQKSYIFQAPTAEERSVWMDALTTAILSGLENRQPTLSRGGSRMGATSQVVLGRIQENAANRVCADCATPDPSWGVINLGIMICINCSGVHRSMGTHIAKVRSIELDQHIWKENIVRLMIEIGNERANRFWAYHYAGELLPADVEREIRENFIRSKYQGKSWIPHTTTVSKEAMSRQLCEAIKTNDLMRTVSLIAHGADVCFVLPGIKDPSCNHALGIAKAHNEELQVELLEQNGALVCSLDMETDTHQVTKKGYLFKTGSERTNWKKRYCSLDPHRGFEYFKSDTDFELLGDIKPDEMLGVAKCEEDPVSVKELKYRHCFEVHTQGRGYLFCADSEEDMENWIYVFSKVISHDNADKLGYDKVGYLRKKDMHGWKRRWFTLQRKSMVYYKKEREEVDHIDLTKVTTLKGPEAEGSFEAQCTFQIILPDRVYHLRADTSTEAELWFSALKHTQVSGIPLSEQQLTTNGLPILIHKCLQFVESYGLETEGIYRKSGEKAKIRKLILAFNQDARGVQIDPETYTVHDVAGALKHFFQCLPDPLLTHKLYPAFTSSVRTTDHEQQLLQLQSLIDRLPNVNKETLKRIIGHLRRVAECEASNKMGIGNLARLFGTTLMTVDEDPVTFENTQYECMCMTVLVKYYKWLFQVAEDETKKEEAISDAMKRIQEAVQRQKSGTIISSNTDFLTTIHIGSKQGESYGIKVSGGTTVSEVVEKIAVEKMLPPSNYTLYLVLGDSESHRVLFTSERLLAILYSAGFDSFLCIKPNTFADTLHPYLDIPVEAVSLFVREKKKWKKYLCSVRGAYFVQYKDSKCHNEMCRLAVNEFDVFAGIERSKIDVKNPLPSRYSFWLKSTKGDDQSKFLCAENEQDMLKIMAALVKAKYPTGLQTPVLPSIQSHRSVPPPPSHTPPMNTSPRHHEVPPPVNPEPSGVKHSGRTR